ncbi:hypothetical protein PtB15_2B422 [Puccinia triticina]|nr:hypothetical protein PtB15_2B422 [Puccinia triticina]
MKPRVEYLVAQQQLGSHRRIVTSKGPPGTPVCPAHPGAKVILGHYRTSAAPETAPAERLFTLPDFTSAE